MSGAMERIKDKIEGLRGDGKRFRKEGRDTLRSSRQRPGERLLEREGPFRRFLKDRDRPLINELKEKGPLRGLLRNQDE